MQKIQFPLRAVGSARGTAGETHRQTSAPRTEPTSPEIRTARLATERLFNLLPPLDVGDPREFIAATVAILARFPAEVMMRAIDPVEGIPSRTDRPTLKLIKSVCEEFHGPIVREEARERAVLAASLERPAPRAPRTAEQQAAIDAQVAAWRRERGLPPNGVPRRGEFAREARWSQPPITKSVLADLEARKARNEQRQPGNDTAGQPKERGTDDSEGSGS